MSGILKGCLGRLCGTRPKNNNNTTRRVMYSPNKKIVKYHNVPYSPSNLRTYVTYTNGTSATLRGSKVLSYTNRKNGPALTPRGVRGGRNTRRRKN